MLVVEILDDDLAHFEFRPVGSPTPTDELIRTTPMVNAAGFLGPSRFADDGQGRIETAEMRIIVDPATLGATVEDVTRRPATRLATFQPRVDADRNAVLDIASDSVQHAYGLGEQFFDPGQANGQWAGRRRAPGDRFGNKLVKFDGGFVGNAQFPVLYAAGEGDANFALFVDELSAITWDLTPGEVADARAKPWSMTTANGGRPLRWYVMSGPDLPDLRRDYVELTGRPPVPPKKAFGLWVCEYGYEDWGEVRGELTALRAHRFPVDGFVLDLQWFGGVGSAGGGSQMGRVAWDRAKFPEPKETIDRLRDDEGVGLILIEESYISERLDEHADLGGRGYLARQHRDGPPVRLENWWGDGGMVDWTNPDAGDYWHDTKRQALVDDGVLGHWTDLGEPEAFDAVAWYHGLDAGDRHSEADVHNLYNFRWVESIARGYARHGVERRPFVLSRSGTSGIQRFGAGMWSGDIGSNLASLASHLNVQMHMSFSGMDYFGADIGGFRRDQLNGDNLDEMYTLWFAHGAAFDVPVRPHTSNTENLHETSPAKIGDVESNLANIRQRYELIPYLYSLAHRAHRFGEPVFPPLVMYYQDDPNVREIADEKLIGRDLLVASITKCGQRSRDVYLPAGEWYNYHTHEHIVSKGEWIKAVPATVDGKFTLPMFARAGAIIPQMHVDEKTMNALGKRTDGARRDELVVTVFADPTQTQFTLYEDDGETTRYQTGEVRETQISQSSGLFHVVIGQSIGKYRGATSQRNHVITYVPVFGSSDVNAVGFSERAPRVKEPSPVILPPLATRAAFDASDRGWFRAEDGVVLAKTGHSDVNSMKFLWFWTDVPDLDPIKDSIESPTSPAARPQGSDPCSNVSAPPDGQ